MEESISLIYDIGAVITIFITIYRAAVYICKADGISGDTVAFAVSSDIDEWQIWYLLLCSAVLWKPLFNTASGKVFAVAERRSVIFIGKGILYLCSGICVYVVGCSLATASLFRSDILE